MKRKVIKNHLKNKLTWNYCYFNVIDENANVIKSFDLLIDAQLYVNDHKEYFIQKCHNISYII